MGNSYRDILIETGQKAQGEYDRVVAAVSGGALVVSFHFVGQTNQPLNATEYAILAWVAWSLSLTAVLVSHLISVRTCERMRDQLDRQQKPSPGWSPAVLWTTNIAGAMLFILGAGGFGTFVLRNLNQ